MDGIIYIITNKLNNKVYIGQTIQNLKDRWYRHCQKKCLSKAESNMAIKRAILKYGKENFTIEILETCDSSMLNERERFYISKYDSYKRGYNETIGGQDGKKPLKLKKELHKEIINLYKSNLSLQKIAERYNVDKATISHILRINHIQIRRYTNTYNLDLIKELLINKVPFRQIEKDYGISRGYLSELKKRFCIE